MGDLRIDPNNEPPKDWLAVNKIERDRRAKEEEDDKCSLEDALLPSILLKGHLLAFAQKVLILLTSSHRKSMTLLIKETDLSRYLHEIKKCLIDLKEKDLSHEPRFLTELSKALRDSSHATLMVEWLIRKKAPLNEKVKDFLDSIYTYTSGSGNALGFYLTEDMGKEWFPAPFMELLLHLHQESLSQKSQSILATWIAQIDKITLDSKK